MTRQEIFDKVWTGINQQGGPSFFLRENEGVLSVYCAYRSEGRKCAAGWLIPDEAYVPDIEGMAALALEEFFGKLAFSHTDVRFIDDLQFIHDQSARVVRVGKEVDDKYFLDIWRERMIAFAARHNLTVPEVSS